MIKLSLAIMLAFLVLTSCKVVQRKSDLNWYDQRSHQ